ncbi:flap endonuclease-1 [Cuniculiplasma sp. SKW3]|uniref:flap endonuclease-1 n=1 Tax=Cuniculiplasma sp. SKW3 TaxID=3400170 RepID=UPI003FD1DD18
MGVNLEPILIKHKTALKDFSGNTVSVDAYNMLYQFLSGIRQPDGTPLMDANGNVTSHLSGIFYRTIALMEDGMRPVYVFDGKPSPMKLKTLEERRLIKERNEEELEKAIANQDLEKIARLKRTINRITTDMIEESKQLLGYMGLPFVQAPSEGEAQASVMSSDGIVQAVISQDYDCLLFGAKRVLRNFTIYGRRRISSRNIYISVDPEYIDLQENLESLSITRDQLIDIGILVGTDFNDGIRKVGPKTALNLIKKHGSIQEVIREKGFEIPELDKVKEIFIKPEANHDISIKFGTPDREKIIDFLCVKHNFSPTRVEPYIEKLSKSLERGNQFNLDSFF